MSCRGARSMAVAAIAALAPVMLAACTSERRAREPDGESLAAKLTRGLSFPQGEVLDGPLPMSSDARAKLLPLGPTVRILPGEPDLMALRVEDPEQRAIGATLIQFSDAPSYVRVPAEIEEGGGSYLVQNDFTAQDDLCEGLCNAIFTVTVTEAIEFENGEISQVSTRQIVVDCRQNGDADACGDTDPSETALEQLCGDPSAGEIAWTSDPVLDAHLEAVRLLSDASAAMSETLDEIRVEMAAQLALGQGASWSELGTALDAQIAANTEAGLSPLLGEQGCALPFAQVRNALRSCDEEAADALEALDCAGVCEPGSDTATCASAQSSGCRGLVEGATCAGRCLGTCELTLDEPAECAGTCEGSCDGECPGGADDCDGPCTGACTGTCSVPSGDACAGVCLGLCDVPVEAELACDEPLAAYCIPATGEALACAGDCFEPQMVDIGGGPCSPSALAVGRVLPRCEPPVVQLSFAFAAGLSAAQQEDFAALAQALNDSLPEWIGALRRLELLIEANADLLDAAEGEIAERLDGLAGDADEGPLACAQQRLPETAAWLAMNLAILQELGSDAALVQPIPP